MVRPTPILIAVAIFPLTFELAKETPKGPVPAVRLEVKAPARENLDLLASVLEGRLLARLHEAETFRLVARDKDAPYTLLLEVQDLKYNVQAERQKPYDAEANPDRLGIQNMLGGELDLDLTLSRAGRQEDIYEDSLIFAASRKLDDPHDQDRVRNLVVDDLLERVAEKLPRLLKRHLKG